MDYRKFKDTCNANPDLMKLVKTVEADQEM